MDEVFATHRAAILSGKMAAEGFVFCVARVAPEDDSPLEEALAQEQAGLLASANLLLRLAAAGVTWPEALSGKERATLTATLAERLNLSVKVHGLQTIFQSREGKGWVAVAALPESEAKAVPHVTLPEAVRLLLSEESWLAPGVPVKALLALHATQKDPPKAVERTPWAAALSAAHFGTPRLRALPRLAGLAPLGWDAPPMDSDYAAGMAAYGQGDLQTAYAAFLASAERAWTYDALNMSGNVARRLGALNEAVPLLLHAAFLRPSGPHPWVHLAFVAKELGNDALCEQCCREAEARVPDSWSKEQLKRLRTGSKAEAPKSVPADVLPAEPMPPAVSLRIQKKSP